MKKVPNNSVNNEPVAASHVPVNMPSAPERLADVDKMALDLARANRKTALAEAQKALAQNETAELSYKYVVLQLYMKYGLTASDAINESDGTLLRGGAVQQSQGQ